MPGRDEGLSYLNWHPQHSRSGQQANDGWHRNWNHTQLPTANIEVDHIVLQLKFRSDGKDNANACWYTQKNPQDHKIQPVKFTRHNGLDGRSLGIWLCLIMDATSGYNTNATVDKLLFKIEEFPSR